MTPVREQIRNIWSEELVAVRNSSGSSLSAFKFLVPTGVYTPTLPDLPIPTAEALSSLSQKPIALLLGTLANNTTTDYTSQVRAKKRGVVQITGFDTTGATIGDKVYCNATGDATLTPTSIDVGVVLVLSANGTIYLNLGDGGSSGGGGSGYANVEDEGNPLTQRSTINFVGPGVTAADAGGKTVVTIPGGGGMNVTAVQTANYNAASNDDIPADSSGGAFNIPFPSTPAHGDRIRITDVAGTFSTNNVTVGANGNAINGIVDDVDLDLDWGVFDFEFFTAHGWILK